MSVATAFLANLEDIAGDVGRLRRRLPADGYDAFLVDRIGSRIDILDGLVQPTAGELVADGEATDAALAHVDARRNQIRMLTGERAA
jgi:hypothetical protein